MAVGGDPGGIIYWGQIIGNEWWIWGESGTVLVRPKWPFAANMGGWTWTWIVSNSIEQFGAAALGVRSECWTGVGFLLLIYVDSCLSGGQDHRSRLHNWESRKWLTWGEEWPLGKDRWFSPADMSGNKNWMVKVTQIVFKLNNLGGGPWKLMVDFGINSCWWTWVGELLFREVEWFFGSRHVWRQDRWIPVLKIKDRGDHGRRTKDILRGPKSLETKKKKNLAAQRVEGTEVLEGQKKNV